MTEYELVILKNRYYSLLSALPAKLWTKEDCEMITLLTNDVDVNVEEAVAAAPLFTPNTMPERPRSFLAQLHSA